MVDLSLNVLSSRERQLLKMASMGLTDSAIATKLSISETTVSTYWRRIRSKVGPLSRTEIVACLLRSECERVVSALMEENRRLLERVSSIASDGSQEFYRRLVEEAADAIVVVSGDGTVELVNQEAAILFGWTQDELRGRHISTLVPDRFRSTHAGHLEEYVAEPGKKKMGTHYSTPALHRDGREFPIAVNLSAYENNGETMVIGIIRGV